MTTQYEFLPVQRVARQGGKTVAGAGIRLRWDLLIFVVAVAISLSTGFQAVSHSSYWSIAQVFGEFMNSPLRLLFPVAAALAAGMRTAEELSHRFVANTRTRADIRQRLTRRCSEAFARVFLTFALVALINAVAAFVIVPALWPHTIDPTSYGLSSADAVREADISAAPLTAALQFGPVVFSLVAAAWFGVNAAIFGIVAVLAVLIIRRAVLALLFPLALHLVESLFFQLLDMPGWSFLVSAVYPTGLQHYDPVQALCPTACLGVLTVIGVAVFVARSRTSPRMS